MSAKTAPEPGRPATVRKGLLGRDGPLLAWLSFIFVIAIFACSLALREGQQFLLEIETEEEAVRWATFLSTEISDMDELVGSGRISAEDRRVFQFANNAGKVFRYKVFGPDGTIVFASRDKDLGKTTDKPYFRDVVQKGRNFVKIEEEDDFGKDRTVVGEAYVPYMDGERFKGAVEVYVDMSARAAVLGRIGDYALFALIGVLSLIGIVCGAFIWRNIQERDREYQEIVESRRKVLEATAAQRENEARLSGVMENVADGIITADTDGLIESFNPAAEKIFGYSADEAVGQNLSILMPDPESRKHDGYVADYLESGRAQFLGAGARDVTGRHKDGSPIVLELATSQMRLGEKTLFIGVTRDVAARKQVEDELLSAKEQAEIANRAKSEFLANMSHELRTPLNAIIGFSDLVQNEVYGALSNPKYAEYATHINESGHHLLSLINDILDLSKIEAGKDDLYEEIVDVTRVIDSCMTLIKERAESGGLRVSLDVPADLPALRADERKLKQILINLLSNAVKFTPPAGKISLTASYREDRGFEFRIADTGIGMSPDDIPKALSPFGQIDSTLDRKYEGTGLGLPLSKALTELHGGTLTIESAPDQGTTVTIVFPAARVVPRPAPQSAETERATA